MAKLSRQAGSTSHVLTVYVQDTTSASGAGLTGLTYSAAGLTCYFKRNRGAASASVTLADIATLGTYVSGGFKEIDPTHMPGAYEFHPPDAALASGSGSVILMLRGATNMLPCLVEIELTATDNQDAIRAGMTALPNAAAGANAGLPVLSNSGGSLAYAVASVTGDVAGKLLGGGSGTINASAIGAMVDIYSVNGTRARFDVYTAQSVGASSITLQSDDPDASANLKNYRVRILSAGNASAAGQIATINSNATSGARPVTPAWGIVPTGTVVYEKLSPLPPVDLASTAFDLVMVEVGYSAKDALKVMLAESGAPANSNGTNTLTFSTIATPTRGSATTLVANMVPVGSAGARDRQAVAITLSGT